MILALLPSAPTTMRGRPTLPPGEPWTHRCAAIASGHDRSGTFRTLPCGITTQGGLAGLRAHVSTVHPGWVDRRLTGAV